MDTPKKTTQITTSVSKFEESPVFNFINSLSPIKPVKSLHVTPGFHSLGFTSLSSIFSSPHLSSPNKSKFFSRSNHSNAGKCELPSENRQNFNGSEGIDKDLARVYDNSTDLQEDFDSGVSADEYSKFSIELLKALKYDCDSPDANMTPCCKVEVDGLSEFADKSLPLVPFEKEAIESNLPEVEVDLQGIDKIEHKNEARECNWESSISDPNLLIFNYPVHEEASKEQIQKYFGTDENFGASRDNILEMQNIEHMDIEDPSNQCGETIELIDNNQANHGMAALCNSEVLVSSNQNKAVYNSRGGVSRRCLDFEVIGNQSKNSDIDCSTSMQSDEKSDSEDKQLLFVKPTNDSARCIAPGIGLHLNSLATSSTPFFHSSTTGQEFEEQLATALDSATSDDAPRASTYSTTEELNQSSPRKKRRRLEGEDMSCKRCNCKKSKCLKLYCECFAAGIYCIEPCSCRDCLNKPTHEDIVLATRKQIESRNPLAFAPKVIRTSESLPENVDESSKTPASARHKRGCNCKKSSCLKKYCECYQGGVGCSTSCRCEGCKNAFGRKDVSAPSDAEAEPEDEAEACENSRIYKILQQTDFQNKEEHNSTLPSTPLRLCSLLDQLPFSSNSKPPRPFFGIVSPSGLHAIKKYEKPNILRAQAKAVKPLQSIPDDDIPEILNGNSSSSNGIKVSPNGKRVSPPKLNMGLRVSSTGKRSSRKLILHSIPSFPALNLQH